MSPQAQSARLEERDLLAFNRRFYEATAAKDRSRLLGLANDFYGILSSHAKPFSPKEYNAACYFGAVLKLLAAADGLSGPERDRWLALISTIVRDEAEHETFRSVVLWSAQEAGFPEAYDLATSVLRGSGLDPASHLSRRSAAVLSRSGRAEDRALLVDVAAAQKSGKTVDAIATFIAASQGEDTPRTLARLRAQQVESVAFQDLSAPTVDGLIALIPAAETGEAKAALDILQRLHDPELRARAFDACCDTLRDQSVTAGIRQKALDAILAMASASGFENEKRMLKRIESTINEEPTYEHKRAYVNALLGATAR